MGGDPGETWRMVLRTLHLAPRGPLVKEKAKTGKVTAHHTEKKGVVAHDVVDLLDLLKKSLSKNGDASAANDEDDDPKKAAAGTIRRDLGTSIGNNVTHGSDAPETAAFEINYFFSGLELI